MVKVALESFGCAANKDNVRIIKGLLKNYDFVSSKDAEVVVINGCIVKNTTKSKLLDLIRDLKNKKIIITGCLPVLKKDILKIVDCAFISSDNLFEIKGLVDNFSCKDVLGVKQIKLNVSKDREDDIEIMQISSGCIGSCTFCLVKLAKGDLFSYPEDMILKHVQSLSSISLLHITSQDNAAYGLDFGTYALVPLVRKIVYLRSDLKIKIGMMNPNHVVKILNDLIELYKLDQIEKFLHIPLQSGSNKVLKEMGREYTREEFLEIVKRFREIEGMNIVTDVIVGYPTETEEDFLETFSLIKLFDVVNISKFSSHRGTKAHSLKQLSSEITKERSRRISRIL